MYSRSQMDSSTTLSRSECRATSQPWPHHAAHCCMLYVACCTALQHNCIIALHVVLDGVCRMFHCGLSVTLLQLHMSNSY